MRRPRVLFICADAVGESMAGVGIRSYELARALQPHADVVIAAAGERHGRLCPMSKWLRITPGRLTP